MSGKQYLKNILRNYDVNVSEAKKAGKKLYPIIENWANGELVKAEFSGSLAKETAINIGTDADIFISISSSSYRKLSELYNSLYKAIQQSGYSARKQNVSIGTTVNGYKIDLVPARRQSQYSNNHSLYKNKTNSWTQTDINKHITYVKNGNRIDEIRLAKIWRKLHNLEFPSFYLEMAVMDALKGSRFGEINDNFIKVLEFFKDNLSSKTYTDPANTNNIISDDLSSYQKILVANQAKSSLSKQYWSNIVW